MRDGLDTLVVKGLEVRYGKFAAINGMDITVRPQEIVCVLGPNGAGKSTLLNAIAGFRDDCDGSVLLEGKEILRMKPESVARGGLSFVPDDRALIKSLRVDEAFSLARANFDFSVEIFPELKGLWRRRCGLLSGGEQMMVALARAMSGAPKLLMLDEFSQGLAPVAVERLCAAIQSAVSTSGVSVLLVEQGIGRALSLADKVYVMNAGRMVLKGLEASTVVANPDLIWDAYVGASESEHSEV